MADTEHADTEHADIGFPGFTLRISPVTLAEVDGDCGYVFVPGHVPAGTRVPCPDGDHDHEVLTVVHTGVVENTTSSASGRARATPDPRGSPGGVFPRTGEPGRGRPAARKGRAFMKRGRGPWRPTARRARPRTGRGWSC